MPTLQDMAGLVVVLAFIAAYAAFAFGMAG
jgi:hypothetical protein